MGTSVIRYAVLDPQGRPAKELAGFTTGNDSTAPGGGANVGSGSALIPFNVGLTFPSDLGLLPQTATPHEVTPRVRVWWNFAGETTAVLQGRIDTPTSVTGTSFVCLWFNNGIWQYLGADANGIYGPTMPADVQGDIIGSPVTLGADVIAAGDVLLGLFASVGAANAQPPGSPPGQTGGTGTTPIGTTAASKTLKVGFSANEAEAGTQSDYANTIDEMVGGGGIIVAENETETHLMPSVHSPVMSNADITFDFSILNYILTTAQAKGIAAKVYLFEGANGTGTSGASPAWYNTEITDLTTAMTVLYAVIDGFFGYIATNFPGLVVEANIGNEIFDSGGARNTNPFQHFIGDTWVRLAMVRGEASLPGTIWQINNDHTEDDSNTALRAAITAFWTDVVQNTTLALLSNANEMHVTAADATSISGKLAIDLVTIFGTGVAWAAWSLSLWNLGKVMTSVSELDVSDYTNDGPAPNAPATTVPLRDAAVADRMMRVVTAAMTLPPGACNEVIFWQFPDLNTWLKAFLTARQDGAAFRPCPVGTVGGNNYARKVCPDGTNLFDRIRAVLTSLPNIGSGSAAGTGSGGTGGVTGGGGAGNPGVGGSGTGVVGSIEPSGMTPLIDTGQITAASAPNVPTTPVSANGISFSLGGPLAAPAGIINSPSGALQLASSVAGGPPSGLAFTFKTGQMNDPAAALGIHFAATPATSTGKLYVRWRGMLGPGWGAALNANGVKLFAPKDSEGNDHIIMAYGPNSVVVPGYGLMVGLQGPTTQNLPTTAVPFPAADAFQAFVWNTFEVAIYPNSSGSLSDGRVVMAINGATAYDSGATLKIFSYSGGVPQWQLIDIYCARAVYSTDPTADMTYFWDQFYLSGG